MLSGHARTPITVNGRVFETVWALWWALAFPDRPDIQEKIRLASGRGVLGIAKHNRDHVRTDWGAYSIPALAWVLLECFDQNEPLLWHHYEATLDFGYIVLLSRNKDLGAVPPRGRYF